MTTDQRRRTQRIEVLGNVACSVLASDGQTYQVKLVNVSMGGLMLHADSPVAGLGEVVEIELRFGKDVRFRSEVKVVEMDPTQVEAFEGTHDKVIIRWMDGRGGNFGVEFMELDERRKRALTKLMDALS